MNPTFTTKWTHSDKTQKLELSIFLYVRLTNYNVLRNLVKSNKDFNKKQEPKNENRKEGQIKKRLYCLPSSNDKENHLREV